MRQRGKRNQTGIDQASMGVRPMGDKWVASWMYYGSTYVHSKEFDHVGLAHNHLLKLMQENKGSK